MKKQTIKIKVVYGKVLGDVEIEAQIVAPGLAVHNEIGPDFFPIPSRWNITHIRSGLALGKSRTSKKEAIAIATRLSHLGNWDIRQSKIGKQLRQQAKAIVGVSHE